MVRNGITLSADECEMLLELIGYKTKNELSKMKPELLHFLSEFRSMVRSFQDEDE